MLSRNSSVLTRSRWTDQLWRCKAAFCSPERADESQVRVQELQSRHGGQAQGAWSAVYSRKWPAGQPHAWINTNRMGRRTETPCLPRTPPTELLSLSFSKRILICCRLCCVHGQLSPDGPFHGPSSAPESRWASYVSDHLEECTVKGQPRGPNKAGKPLDDCVLSTTRICPPGSPQNQRPTCIACLDDDELSR